MAWLACVHVCTNVRALQKFVTAGGGHSHQPDSYSSLLPSLPPPLPSSLEGYLHFKAGEQWG